MPPVRIRLKSSIRSAAACRYRVGLKSYSRAVERLPIEALRRAHTCYSPPVFSNEFGQMRPFVAVANHILPTQTFPMMNRYGRRRDLH